MGKIYSGGVIIPTGFKVEDETHIDDRNAVTLYSDLASLKAPIGQISYVQERQKAFIKTEASTWVELGGSSSGTGAYSSDISRIDNTISQIQNSLNNKTDNGGYGGTAKNIADLVTGLPQWIKNVTISTEDIQRWNTAARGGVVDLSNYYTKQQSDERYALKTHKHNISDIADLEQRLANAGNNVNLSAYLTREEANNSYATKNHAHANYLTSEADPTVPQWVKAITQQDIQNWNTAVGGGNVDLSNYLQKEEATRLYATKSHTHTIADVTNLQTTLNGKEPSFSKNSAFNKNFGTTAGTVAQGNHTHEVSDITGLQQALNTKANSSDVHTHANKSVLDGINASKVSIWDRTDVFIGDTSPLTGSTISIDNRNDWQGKVWTIEHAGDTESLPNITLQNGGTVRILTNGYVRGKVNVIMVHCFSATRKIYHVTVKNQEN